jgi:hypothetical protein
MTTKNNNMITVHIDDDRRLTKRRKIKPTVQQHTARGDGVLIIPMDNDVQMKKQTTHISDDVGPVESANVKIIATINIKDTKEQILQSPEVYTAAQVVGIFRNHYTNKNTLSVMLSRFKNELLRLDPVPTWVDGVKLSKKEYREIRTSSVEARTRGAMNVRVISCSDALITQALEYMCSSDPKLLYAGTIAVSGWRPIEVIKMALVRSKLNNQQGAATPHYGCQYRFAKRGRNMKTTYAACRDKVFLCPYYLVERALRIIRNHWNVQHLTNTQINRKLSSTLAKILTCAFPMMPGVNARILRRHYCLYAYEYFGRSGFFHEGSSQASLIGFSHWMLGHAVLSDEAISYNSLKLHPRPKLPLLKMGKQLKVGSPASSLTQTRSPRSQRSPRKKEIKPAQGSDHDVVEEID